MRCRERERDARVVRRTKNKESAFLSLPNDVITDMADCGEEEDDKEKEKKKGNALSHARRVLVRLHLIYLSFLITAARDKDDDDDDVRASESHVTRGSSSIPRFPRERELERER